MSLPWTRSAPFGAAMRSIAYASRPTGAETVRVGPVCAPWTRSISGSAATGFPGLVALRTEGMRPKIREAIKRSGTVAMSREG